MKIKSKFKDYYDFVSHIYGGGDEKIIYNRDRINPLRNNGLEESIKIKNNKISSLPYNIGQYHTSDKIKFKWLVVNAKCYLLVGYQLEFGFTEYHVLNEKDDIDFLNHIGISQRYYWNSYKRTCITDFNGVYSDELLNVSRELNQPVFIIDSVFHQEIVVNNRIPNLGELGFASIIKSELLYQEIAYFLSNVMVESADIKAPVEVDNKDKIQQAGFDLKQSFRHRK